MINEMVQGYLDGCHAAEIDVPEMPARRGAQYLHGWLNGRDDRIGVPRAVAAELRTMAAAAFAYDVGKWEHRGIN